MSKITITLSIYFIAQMLLLVIRYDLYNILHENMPWWVTWFPSLIIGVFLGIFICFIIVILIGLLVWGGILLGQTIYDKIKYGKEKYY